MPYVMKGSTARWISEEEALTYVLQPGEVMNGIELVLPEPTHADLRARVIVLAKALRTELFKPADNVHTAFLTKWAQNQTSENLAEVGAIETYKQGLRDITLIDLSGATTEAQMKTIVSAQYALLKNALPASVKNKFNETLQ